MNSDLAMPAESGSKAATETPKPESASTEKTLPLLPVRNAVAFPQLVLPLTVGRLKSRLAIETALKAGGEVAIFCQKDPKVEDPGGKDLFEIGVIAKILKSVRTAEQTLTVVVQGERRVRLTGVEEKTVSTDTEERYLAAHTLELETPAAEGVEIDALTVNLRKQVRKVVKLSPRWNEEVSIIVMNIEQPSTLADLVASQLDVPTGEKQILLETLDIKERLKGVTRHLAHELDVLELGAKIQSEVRGEFEKAQRQHYLREQLRAIRKELGEGEGGEVAELREKIEKASMTKEAKEAARKEVERLSVISNASAEYGVIRSYLDWLLEIPWKKFTEDKLDIAKAREVLDADHYGLEEVKQRILEILSIRKLKKDSRGPILCFAGPPGVGKTSLGRSIAAALGRSFIRVSLGGIVDEAEIRGHRRTYVGALPGRIVSGMRKAGSTNPVFMLDEIDKVGVSYHGDPSAALLEVLDPAQNYAFMDHYLDVPLDLSQVLFITTANMLDTIPGPLRDRMEIIRIPGYTDEEKIQISQRYLLPRQIEEHGLSKEKVSVSNEALHFLLDNYTREAGVRELERRVAGILRKIAHAVASGKTGEFSIGPKEVREYLGAEKYQRDIAERTQKSGVATGLAWTPTGGDILFFEANTVPGSGHLTLTGSLGEVMKESARIALSYLRTQAKALHIPEKKIPHSDIHLHVPAGAIPKDGPSAGVAILTALASAFTGRKTRSDVALTGEITLRGLVLPVGGIKEKVLAASRAGIKKVILPEKNRGDLEEVPKEVQEKLEFVFVSDMKESLEHSLENLKASVKISPKKAKLPRRKKR